MNIHVKNGRLIDPKNKIDARQDVYIVDRRIASVGKPPSGFAAEQTIEESALLSVARCSAVLLAAAAVGECNQD